MTRRRLLQFLPLGALLLLALALLPTAAARPLPGSDKIEPLLLDRLAAEGRADFLVRFVPQADLAPAYTMGWEARGQFVVDALQATAGQSQGAARTYLDGRGLKHQTFIAGNELYVWAGDLPAVQALAALSEVGYIRATRTYFVDPILAAAPDSPDVLDWGITDPKADQFWTTFGRQGDGIVVANIDTGVQWDHPALDQAFRCGANPANPACWYDPSNVCGGAACDNVGHGTHTMGTIVGDDDPTLTYQVGMAPNAQWIACKGCENTSCSDAALNACADWILQPAGNPANRPHVVNNSWGGGGCNPWYLAKVQAWRAAGTFPAFSAGNAGPGCTTLGSPGDYQESFATAAHDYYRTIADFSSRGPSCFGHDPYTKPNISAPGVSICSSVPTNAWNCGYSGSSMASPHSAGAVALLWSCNPALVGQVDPTFQLLQNTADPPPTGNCDQPGDGGNYTYGYGYLNVLAAGAASCVQDGTLAGHVYDESGNPLPGATVTANPGGTSATTNVQGYYMMPLAPGNYDATAAMPGFQSQTAAVVIVGGQTTVQDFYLLYEGLWTMGPTMCFDLTRFDAEFVPATGLVYILGGRSGTSTVGNIYAYDPASGSCADTGATMPTPISNYTANLVNNGTADLLCTFGGRAADGTNTADVQCYNPFTNAAAVVTQLPAPYAGYIPGAQVVLDNQVYLFGGFRSTSAPYDLDLTYYYLPASHYFGQMGPLSLARSYIFGGVVGKSIYAFGGTVFDGTSLVAQTRAEVLHIVPYTYYWSDADVADLPVATAEGQAFSFDEYIYPGYAGKIVLAGGGQWPNQTEEALVYSAATDSYDYGIPDLNVARRNHAGVLIPLCTSTPGDGQPALWVLGGRCSASGCGLDNPPYAPAEYLPLPCTPPVQACTLPPQQGLASAGPEQTGIRRGHWSSTDFQPLNITPDAESITASFLDPNGELRQSYDFTLPGGGTGVFTPNTSLPPGFTGTLLLETAGQVAFGVVHLEDPPDAGNTVFPSAPDAMVGRQAYAPVDGCTAIHIHNLDLSAIANVAVFLYDLTGTPVSALAYQVAPRGTQSADLRMQHDLPPGFSGGAVVVADQLIQVTTQGQCDGYSAIDAAAYCSNDLYAPYVPSSQAGLVSTTIVVQNPTDAQVSVGISYTAGMDFADIPPWGSHAFPHTYGEDEWAHVQPMYNPIAPLVVTVQTLSHNPANRGVSGYRAVPLAEATRAVALPVLFAGDHGWQTGNRIWVMNVGTVSTTVTIRFSNNADDSLAWAQQVLSPEEVWRVPLPMLPGTRAAAIALADPDQPIIAVAGAWNPNPDLQDSQILYAGTNFPFPYVPVKEADFTALVNVNVVTFDGSVSGGDPPIDYTWDFGDGTTGMGAHVVHVYTAAGTYTVVMTATNNLGFYSATTSQLVTVEQGTVYNIYLPIVVKSFHGR